MSHLDWWLSRAGDLVSHWRQMPPDLGLLSRWLAQSLGETLLLILADLLAGAALLAALRVWLPARLRGAVALTLGGGIAALLLFALGGLNRLQPGWVLGLTVLAALPGAWLLRTRRGRWHVFGWLFALRPSAAWLPLIAALVALQSLDWLMPVLDFDSALYHAASARWYEQTGGVPYHGGIRFNAQPHLPALLYLRQLELLDDQRLKLINLEFALVMVLAVAHTARRRRIPVPLALAVLGLSPVFWWMSRTEYADLAMAAWFAAGMALLLDARPRPWLAGLALGLAGAAKLQGLVMAALAGGAYLVVTRRWRDVVPFAAGGVLWGLPWWLRSWRHTGSPIHPFFTASPDTAGLFEVSARYGLGHDWVAFLRLPWDACFGDFRVYADPYPFGPVLLIVIVAVAMAVFGRQVPRAAWIPLLALAGYLVFWFRTGQVMRYLAAWLPVMAMSFAAVAGGWARRRVWLAPAAAGALVCFLFALTTVRFASPPPVRFIERERLLANHVPHYAAVRELNRVRQPQDRTYLLFCEDARFYVDGMSYGDWFGEYAYGWAGDPRSTPESIVARLREAGFHYVLVDRTRARVGGQLYSAAFRESGFLKANQPVPDGLQQIYTDGRHVLWKIQ